MASIWKVDGQDIYVDSFVRTPQGNVAELNPLNSTHSIYHKTYKSDDEITLTGVVIGETYDSNIRSTNHTTVTLITDLVPGGFSVFIMDVQSTRMKTLNQFIDLLQDKEAPVYTIAITARIV